MRPAINIPLMTIFSIYLLFFISTAQTRVQIVSRMFYFYRLCTYWLRGTMSKKWKNRESKWREHFHGAHILPAVNFKLKRLFILSHSLPSYNFTRAVYTSRSSCTVRWIMVANKYYNFIASCTFSSRIRCCPATLDSLNNIINILLLLSVTACSLSFWLSLASSPFT